MPELTPEDQHILRMLRERKTALERELAEKQANLGKVNEAIIGLTGGRAAGDAEAVLPAVAPGEFLSTPSHAAVERLLAVAGRPLLLRDVAHLLMAGDIRGKDGEPWSQKRAEPNTRIAIGQTQGRLFVQEHEGRDYVMRKGWGAEMLRRVG